MWDLVYDLQEDMGIILFHDKPIAFHPNYGLWKYNLPFCFPLIPKTLVMFSVGNLKYWAISGISSKNCWWFGFFCDCMHNRMKKKIQKRISLISQLFLLADNEMKQRSFAGVSYFSEIVKQKDPSVSSRVSQQIVLKFILSFTSNFQRFILK